MGGDDELMLGEKKQRLERIMMPRLHNTTGCQTGCTAGLTTGLTTGCILYTAGKH